MPRLRATRLTAIAQAVRRLGLVNSATDWYFAALGLAGTPWADVSRTGLGTRVDSAGLVGFGPHNLLLNSQDISNAYWTKNNSSAASATSLVEDTSTTQHIVVRFGLSVTAATPHVLFARVKTNGRRYVNVRANSNATNSNAASVMVDLNTGSIFGAATSYGTWSGASATIAASTVEAGAYDIALTFTTADAVISAKIEMSSDGARNASGECTAYTGNGTSGIFIYAAALNQGALTAYVPTTTTARYLPRITHDPALDINGNPYTVTEQYGPELVTNGDFQATLAGWTAGNGNISGVVTSGEAILTANGSGSGGYIQDVSVTPGRTYRFRIKARKISGPDAVRVQIWDGASFTTVLSQLFDLTTPAPLEARTIYVRPATSTLRIYLFCATSCVGGFDDASITEYLGTVTTGTPRPLGLLVEGQGTNLYPVSDTPSTRTVTVTAAAHTLSVYGTCTITLSGAATGTLTATGAANIRTTLTFTPSAGSLTMTVSGLTTGNRAQLETGSVATSYIPNPGTGSAVRVADSAGPGVALTGAALAAAFPAGFGQNTIVLRFRKSYSGALETLLALSAGASYSTGNGLLIRADGQAVTSGGNGSAAVVPAALVLDGAAVNRVAVSWSGANLSLSVNGSAAVPIGNLDFTGSGTTHLILGALTTGGLQGIGQAILESVRVLPGQYITGAALQALTA